MAWEERYVTVCIEGGHREFFDRFLLSVAVRRLVIVSPWITIDGEHRDVILSAIDKIAREVIPTTIVLRHPNREATNRRAVEVLSQLGSVDLHYNDELHAKVYVCRCSPSGYAYVGSANLTGRATTAFEVGLMVDGRGVGVGVLDELEQLANDLLGRAGTYDRIAPR